MSARTERWVGAGARRGVALLLALVMTVVVAVCVLALWHTRAGAFRSDRLRAARMQLDTETDSMLALGIDAVTDDAWRTLVRPGTSLDILSSFTSRGAIRSRVARLGWATLLVEGQASGKSGVAGVTASAVQRVLIPLQSPLALPSAALTGALPWRIDPRATVELASATPGEVWCRDGTMPALMQVDTLPVALDASRVVPLDPDTVSAPLTGVFRLMRDRIRRPMVVDGMVESVTGLSLGADLQIVGVLVVQGSVQPAGGRLHVTGAVITRDSGGAGSVLGNGDRVRYDACAIRRAVERATRPAPAVMWSAEGRP